MRNKDIPQINWDEQPSPDAVWIVNNNTEFGAGWHTLSENGKQYVDKHWQYWPKSGEGKEFTVYRREDYVSEWQPAAGEYCVHVRHRFTNEESKENVFIIGIDKLGNYVFQNEDSMCYYSDPVSEFEPAKTQHELDREAFVHAAMKSHISTGLEVSDESLKTLFEEMFDNNFKAPEE